MREGTARCGACGRWHVSETTASDARRYRLRDAPRSTWERVSVGFGDLVLGGGFCRMHVVLLGGEPGPGKSTLALQWAASFKSCLYVSAEEPPEQVRERAERVRPALLDVVDVVDAMGGLSIESALSGEPLELIVVDSLPGLVGVGPASDHDALAVLKTLKMHVSRHRSCALVIDHATKSDGFAGRLTLQHEVDATVLIEAEDRSTRRTLHVLKNRSGPPAVEDGDLRHGGFIQS